MEFDFIFGDIRVQVIFKADSDSEFGQLTDHETMILQQCVYMTLTTFAYLKTMYRIGKESDNELEG